MSKRLYLNRVSTLCMLLPILLAGGASTWAAPFDEQISFMQPDGAQIQLHGRGDEFYAVFETLGGYTVVFDQALRAYCYATVAADGQLVSSGVQVQAARGQSLGLDQHLRMSPESIKAQVAARYSAWDTEMDTATRWKSLKAMSGSTSVSDAFSPPPNTTTGTKVGLTLLIDFDDDVATVPQANIDNFCNGDTYTGYGNNGSVKKYYYDNSSGKLTYSNVVTIYIRAPKPKSTYNDTSRDAGQQARILINDVLTVMKGMTNFDTEIRPAFDALTVDANNTCVAFNVFYAGGNGGVWSMGLWPHSWSLASAVELWPGGKKVRRYQVTNIGSRLSIGTFCHENGHMLCGFPDLYDYDYDSTGGAGNFCLMGYGGSDSNPVQICAYLKRAAGWATSVDLSPSASLVGTVSLVGTNFNRIYRYQKPGTATEYYLVECRYKTNRDASLPSSGVAVWHIDELGDRDNQSLKPNTTHANYEVTLVQADNLWDFEKDKNAGNSTDLYYLGNKASAYSNELTDTSAPNANWWDGTPSGLALRSFSAASNTMTFIVGTNDPLPSIVAPPQNRTVVAGLPVQFTVSANGFPPLTYQWLKDGAPLSGATTSAYNIVAAQDSDAGGYSVAVSNEFGGLISSSATLTIIQTVPLPFALNNSNLTWTSAAPLFWYGQTSGSHDSEAAAQAVPLADGEQAKLSTTVSGPGTLSFWWRVSSEQGADTLNFSIGSNAQAGISGESGWQQQTFYVGSGSQALEWAYGKDAGGSAGQDSAWLDEVTWTSGSTLPFIVAQPQDQTSLGGTPVHFEVVANGTPQLTYQWLFNGADVPGATSTAFTIASPQKIDNGGYSVRVINPYGSITSSVATMAVVPLAVFGDNTFTQAKVSAAAADAITISAGGWHSLALNANGTVAAWGANGDGECSVPPGLSKVVGIAAGGYHSLALLANRKVVGWGANYSGQTKPPANLNNVVEVAAGQWHSVALKADGQVMAWGDNTWGQTDVPAAASNAIAIAASGNHNLALGRDGIVIAWGENVNAEGLFVGQSVVPWGLADVVAIAAGEYHSLALKRDGTIVAWGDNSLGQCDTPAGLAGPVAIAAGGGHSLALMADGSARGWGADWNGQCDVPVGLTNVLAIAGGSAHTLLLVGSPNPTLQLEVPAWQANTFSVSLQTYAGRNYALEYKNSLGADTWLSLPEVAGDGSRRFLVDPNASRPNRTYRVRQW